MAEASRYVSLTISIQDAAFASPSFGALLVLGNSPTGDAGMHSIAATPAGLTAYVDDLSGAVTDAVYKSLSAVIAQTPHTSELKWYNSKITNTASIEYTPIGPFTEGKAYSITVSGTKCSYTVQAADTATEVATALHTLIDALTGVSSTDNTGSFTLVNADGYTDVLDDAWSPKQFTVVDSSTTSSVITDALDAALADDPDFYGVVLDIKDATNIAAAASWCETNGKQPLFRSRETDNLSGNGVGKTLYDAGYHYSTVVFQEDSDNPAEAALHGRQLALTPGTSDYQFKRLAGPTVSTLSDSQINGASGINVMTYTRTRGVAMTDNGLAASGRPIALTRNVDWLENEILVNILNEFGNNEIVTLDSEGIAKMEKAIRAAMQEGQDIGVLQPGWTVTAPTTISQTDKNAGLMAGFSFNGVTRVGTRKVEIQGTLQ